ncbi:hypothetical protein EI94DRAFT_1730620 [Lactarius quietus]|nr:hypothetical protein EI94DRAFT_1730620 [Lactarius quietus]
MLFQQTLISFVTAMALASSVTASAILGRKGATCGPGTGSLLCCNSSSPFSELPSDEQAVITQLQFTELNSNLNTSLIVGSDCTAPSEGSQCSNQTLCCNSSVLNINDGEFMFNVNCVNPV